MRMITGLTLGILVTLFALSAVADGNKGKAENKSADRSPQVQVDGTDRHRKDQDRRGDHERDRDEDHDEDQDGPHADRTGQADESGNVKAREMRERRDQRKETQQEYRDSGEKQSGKKPWWKFWDEDET